MCISSNTNIYPVDLKKLQMTYTINSVKSVYIRSNSVYPDAHEAVWSESILFAISLF